MFLAIGVGYLVGQINLGGFSLGVGAVLFVGLAIGAFAPKANIVGPIGLTGLVMFLYGIGILYGRQFFEGMAGSVGIKANVLALIAVMAGLLVAHTSGWTTMIVFAAVIAVAAAVATGSAGMRSMRPLTESPTAAGDGVDEASPRGEPDPADVAPKRP